MAREFNGTNQHIEIQTAVLTAEPITMVCWFKADSVTASGYAMCIADLSETDQFWAMQIAGSVGGDPVRAVSVGGGGTSASTSTGYSQDTWQHACCVWAADNDRRAYIDGGSKGTDATNIATTGVDRTSIGRSGDSSPAWFDGSVAEAAIWSVALTDNEIFRLAQGIPCVFVRPQSLAGYWSCYETDRDFWRSIYNMTAFNTPTWDSHPPKVLEFWRRYQDRAVTLQGPIARIAPWVWNVWQPPGNAGVAVRQPRYGFTNFQIPGIV